MSCCGFLRGNAGLATGVLTFGCLALAGGRRGVCCAGPWGERLGLMLSPYLADGRCHGDDDPEYPGTTTALRVATPQLAGGTADLGRQPSAPCGCVQLWSPGCSVGCPPHLLLPRAQQKRSKPWRKYCDLGCL
jgi:hypothetical protein